MNMLETRAAELRAAFISNAIELGLLPEEIVAVTDDSDGDDYFLREAENEARRALAASRQMHRRAIRAVTPRKPPTRRAPRRAAKKASVSAGGGGDDGDGPGPWSIEAIDNFYSFRALPLLSPTFRTTCGEFVKYRGATVLGPVPRVAVSIVKIGGLSTRAFTLSWVDAATGRFGFGVVALVAHILRISETDAADRLARFAANVQAARDAGVSAETAIERFKVGYISLFERRAA
jgi:hypothetical protein